MSLIDVDYDNPDYTSLDTLTHSTVEETVVTDDSGRFDIDHHVNTGGCGIDQLLALLIAPDGPTGSVAVMVAQDSDGSHHLDTGPLQLLPAITATTTDGVVKVRTPAAVEDRLMVRVDGSSWFAAADGTLAKEALLACKEGGACDHTVTLASVTGPLRRRSGTVTVHAPGIAPIYGGPLPQIATEVELPKASVLSSVFVDHVFTETQVADPAFFSEIPMKYLLENGAHLDSMPVGTCTPYGTGIRCTAPKAAIDALYFPTLTLVELRAFGS